MAPSLQVTVISNCDAPVSTLSSTTEGCCAGNLEGNRSVLLVQQPSPEPTPITQFCFRDGVPDEQASGLYRDLLDGAVSLDSELKSQSFLPLLLSVLRSDVVAARRRGFEKRSPAFLSRRLSGRLSEWASAFHILRAGDNFSGELSSVVIEQCDF